MKRVALFGGTFDPVHRGHLFIAERAQARCGLDEVIFMPCWRSPHKLGETSAPGEDRLAMLQLALSEGDHSWASVSPWELERQSASYSWQTGEHWSREVLAEEDALYWILGADQWEALSGWARVDYLSSLLTFIVFPRAGHRLESQPGMEAVFLSDAMRVSASEIRTLCGRGASIEDDVGRPVAAYIRENRLYADA